VTAAAGRNARPGLPRILVLARAYPNSALPGQGLWAVRLVRAALPIADPVVVSSIPWAPPGVPVPEWRRLRKVPPRATYDDVDVRYPRVFGGLLYATHSLDARLGFGPLRALVLKLHRERRFDLIHAHFIYPDGVMGVRLGGELGIPVVTTEHAHWKPWLDSQPAVRAQVLAALPGIRIITAVSEATRRTIRDVAGTAPRVELLPNVLDERTFAPAGSAPRVACRILFVGNVRRVKGLDVLVRALASLQSALPEVHLRVIGSALSPSYRRDEMAVRRLAISLGIANRIAFLGHLGPADVSEEMQRAAVVVVPSRRESFSAVTIEALASGTPVVATRCGGPEELLDDAAGRLVPVDDPSAMATAIGDVLRAADRFDPAQLRARVLPRFGWAATTERLRQLYAAAGMANR
jgi:teichuronic acid biosynthesis glycosyltransferase TuaC